MRDEGKEKAINNADAILNAITVEEAIAAFRKIEKWIIEILQSSTEDFLALNNQFKVYHRESKNISENVLQIIRALTDHQLTTTFQHLKSIVEGFNKLSEHFSSRIESFEIDLKKSIHKVENLRIAYQNFRQVIISSPLLLVNEHKTATPSNSDNNEIGTIKQLLQQTETLLNDFIVKAQENSLFLSDIKKDNYIHLQRLNDNIEIGFELFYRKHQEANQFSAALKAQAENNASYVSTIITNLQYHDIIRQKIEHIQRTHHDILSDLEKFLSGESDDTFIHNKAKTYIKIRDISGLQAAQLIHANNQYQVAIQEIFKGLEEIGNNMIAINSMCENLVGKSGQSKKYYLENIVENLHGALEYNQKLMQLTHQINEQTQTLNDIVNSIDNLNEKIFSKAQDYFISLSSTIVGKEKNPTYNEWQNLNRECISHQQQISTLSGELKHKISILYQLISEFEREGNLLQSFQSVSLTIPDLINLLQKSIKDVDEFLFLNSSISQKISNEIHQTVYRVKYYELFEKTCEKIINELNSLNIRLNYGYDLSAKEREENLKILKSRYTMASEHLIHDQLSQISNISEVLTTNSEKIIEIANQNSDPNEENLELF
ncbi:MAG: hypothetical protein N2662_09785 [Bacteroidales bacterium]|nr:hypothetical protein [Bacteroidales bacterium]